MSRHHDVVVTLAQVFCSLSLVVMMSRHCRLHWLFLMSRPQFSCRDISSWYCTFERVSPVVAMSTHGFEAFSCLCFDPCRDLHQIPFNLPDVATSELDCVDLQSALMTQPVAFISVLPIDCTFIHLLLHFSSFFLSSY